MLLGICSAPSSRPIAEALAERLFRNFGIETLPVEADGAPVCETWEEAQAADAILLLLSADAVPRRLQRQDWEGLLAYPGRVGTLLVEACPYPALLERRAFLRWPDETRGLERWIAGMLPAQAGMRLAPAGAEAPEVLWEELVDRPGAFWITGSAGSGKSDLAQEFARQAAGHFQGVAWIACGERTANSILGEMEHLLHGERMLVVLDDLRTPPPPVPGRHSVLITSGECPGGVAGYPMAAEEGRPPLEEHPLWEAMSACFAPNLPLWLARKIASDRQSAPEAFAGAIDEEGTRFRLRKPCLVSESFRFRHLRAVHASFQSWRKDPAACLSLLYEVPGAIGYSRERHWPMGVEVGRAAFSYLEDQGRRREAIEIMVLLLDSAEARGDREVAEQARSELSWVTDIHFQPRRRVENAEQMGLFG